jgi:hypothetical protein
MPFQEERANRGPFMTSQRKTRLLWVAAMALTAVGMYAATIVRLAIRN